jgi:hypothetical protein
LKDLLVGNGRFNYLTKNFNFFLRDRAQKYFQVIDTMFIWELVKSLEDCQTESSRGTGEDYLLSYFMEGYFHVITA